jgi:hypothetical protein
MASAFIAVVTPLDGGSRSVVMVEPLGAEGLPGHDLPSGPVYPGHGLPGSQPRPDQGLPGGPPPHPWFPGHIGRPDRPDQGLPGGGWPGHPDQGLPGSGGRPDQGLPPLPPTPGHPENPIVLPPQAGNLPVFPVAPDNTLPEIPPGVVWPPLPPSVPQGKAIALVAISGVGYRWTVIDTSLSAGWPLPPTAQPK